MIGLSEAGSISLVTALLSGVTLIVVALIGQGNRRRSSVAAEERAELKEAVQAENGHPSLGAGVAAIEERLIEGEQHFGRLDMKVSEALALTAETREDVRAVAERLDRHLTEVDPLIAWAIEQSGIEIPRKED